MDTARSIVHSVTHYIKNTDLYLMLLGLVCSIYGMLLIYSATLNPVTALDGSTKNLYVQGAAIILGLAAFIALSLIDLENLGDLWKIFVIGNILLYAARHRGQRPACMAQSGRDKPAAG